MIGKIKRLINLFSIPALVFCASSSAFVLPVSAQQSQQPQEQKLPYAVDRANVADALAKVESGQFSAVHVDLITRARCEEGDADTERAVRANSRPHVKRQSLLLRWYVRVRGMTSIGITC